MGYLFFSTESEMPAGYYLMNLWDPIEKAFNSMHCATEYGNQLDHICIVFICTSNNLLSAGFYPEKKYLSIKKRFADYRFVIPYRLFVEGDFLERWSLTFEPLSHSLNDIQRKNPVFQSCKLISDIKNVALKLYPQLSIDKYNL